MRGAEDPLVSAAEAEKPAAAIPGARLRTVDGAGHACDRDQPETFDRAVTEFLDSTGYAGAAKG